MTDIYDQATVSTRSRPKAAGCRFGCMTMPTACFNTQPPEGGWSPNRLYSSIAGLFQHAAARRRLGRGDARQDFLHGFNTQPPEGGWFRRLLYNRKKNGFNTQPPEGGWNLRCYST